MKLDTERPPSDGKPCRYCIYEMYHFGMEPQELENVWRAVFIFCEGIMDMDLMNALISETLVES